MSPASKMALLALASSADLGGLRQDHPGHAEEPADQDLLWRARAGAQPLGAAGCCCCCGCWGLAVATAGCCCQSHTLPARVASAAVVGGCVCCSAAHRSSAPHQSTLCRRATCPTTTRSSRTRWIWAPSKVRVRIGAACSCNSRIGHDSKAAAGCWLVPRAVQHPHVASLGHPAALGAEAAAHPSCAQRLRLLPTYLLQPRLMGGGTTMFTSSATMCASPSTTAASSTRRVRAAAVARGCLCWLRLTTDPAASCCPRPRCTAHCLPAAYLET